MAVLRTSAGAATPAPARVPVILELFTSEGCSSCPPADQILKDVMATQPVEGALVIGLSEHVDYWDRLGWKDPFSAALFSRRQDDYAAHAGSANIYTPQMIVDGGAEFVGSDRAKALAAVRAAAAAPKRAIQLTWSTAKPGWLDIDVPAGTEKQAARVFLAVTEDGLSTKVTRGENSGHTLAHDGVVRRLVELGQTDGSGMYHATVPVPLDAASIRANAHVVVFAQRKGTAITAAGTLAAK
jgi:hypothetical protein